jgi:hypothetical protein
VALTIRTQTPSWRHADILLYGQPKVGKTTTAAHAPAPLLLNVYGEGGMNALHGDIADIRSVRDFADAVRLLEAGKHSYHSAVLDSLDALYALALREHGGEARDERQRHRNAAAALVPVMRQWHHLPVFKMTTAHHRADRMEEGTGRDKIVKTRIGLALPERFSVTVAGLYDIIAYCFVRNTQRHFTATPRVTPTQEVQAGDRTGRYHADMYPLAWDTFAPLVEGGMDDTAGS